VAKRRDSTSGPGRSRWWLKTKHRATAWFDVAGWRPTTPGTGATWALPCSLPGSSSPATSSASPWSRGDISQDGIYIGDGEMIDAPDTGSVVCIDNLATNWTSVPRVVRRFG
jgi:hypothetical protein